MHLAATSILSLLNSYGYPALAVIVALAAAGAPLPFPMTMTFVTLGALSAAPRGPNDLALLVIGALAATVGHSADYGVGRSGSLIVRRWRARLERRIGSQTLSSVERRLAQSSALVILLTRFPLTPLASPVSLVAGVTGMTYRRFLALELLGETVYFTTCLLLGRLLGPALTRHPALFALGLLLATLLLLAPMALLRWLARSGVARDAHAIPTETLASVSGDPSLPARPSARLYPFDSSSPACVQAPIQHGLTSPLSPLQGDVGKPRCH